MSDSSAANAFPDDNIHHYFAYDPNWAAAIFFIVFFFLLTLILAYQSERAKPRPQRWLHALTLMSAMESAGYIARLVLYAQPGGAPFKAELILLILAPNLLALCCYVVLGKLITFLFHTRRSTANIPVDNWIIRHPRWIPRFYVASDLLCISIQSVGGALLSSATTQSQDNTGKAVEVAGLTLQLFFIATFVLICLYVWRLARAHHAPAVLAEVTPTFGLMCAVIALLVTRNAYRTVEFASGTFTSGPTQNVETWYLVFDPTLMSAALMIVIAFDLTKRMPVDALNPPTSTVPVEDVEMGVKVPASPMPLHVSASSDNAED